MPEALGIRKALLKFSSIAAIFLLDFTLPNVARLSKALQTKQLDLSIISKLVDATLETLDDAVTPAANWVLELLDAKDALQDAIGEVINTDKIHSFQENVGNPFITHLIIQPICLIS